MEKKGIKVQLLLKKVGTSIDIGKSKEKIAPVKPKTEEDIIKDSGLLEAY